MNKVKLMYDVIMTMREKEALKGIFQLEARKDQVTMARVDNAFEKNLSTGETKATINAELDCEGKKVKHQCSTEFNMQDCHAGLHKGLLGHIHMKHHQGQDADCCEGMKKGSFKDKLAKIALVMHIFNNIKAEEQVDKSVILSLNLNEIPEDLKQSIHEKMKKRHEGHQQDCCMKEFFSMEQQEAELKVWVSKNSDVEKAALTVIGKQKNEKNEVHIIDVKAELNMAW